MNQPEHRISDEMASEVLAEAARLNVEAHKGYSLKDLEQAGLEAQIPPEIIGQALKIVEQRRQAKQMKWQRVKKRIRQQVQSWTAIGRPLNIPIALAAGVLVALPLVYPLLRLPHLQDQVQELKNENLKIQTRLDAANQELELKDAKVEQLQQSNDQYLSEVRQLEQEIRVLKSRDVDPQTGLMFRDSFTKAVIKQNKYQVIQAVGKPNRTKDSGKYSYWYYDNKTKDRITGKLDNSISILFVNGIADKVDSSN